MTIKESHHEQLEESMISIHALTSTTTHQTMQV